MAERPWRFKSSLRHDFLSPFYDYSEIKGLALNIYLGTFLISFTTLALEVTLTRILSVTTWYHLAFFAVSTAMLGMTSGAVTVYLKPQWFSGQKLNSNVAKACIGYAMVTPISLFVLCLLPIVLATPVMCFIALCLTTAACAMPFFFSGIAICAVLTKCQLPIGKIYASDLIGASFGCLFVLGGLEIFDAPSFILLCSAVGILAAIGFERNTESSEIKRLINRGFLIILLFFTLVNSIFHGVRPIVSKGKIETGRNFLMEKWNSFSRIVVYQSVRGKPTYWGASPVAPNPTNILAHRMDMDGNASTYVHEFSSLLDIDWLRYDVTNVAYYLRPKGNVCVIGVGGGRDIQSALLFDHDKIVGIDINPIFIALQKGKFRDFSRIADRKDVTLVVDEARSWLSRTKEKFSVIQMSLIDTWAATAAGAFTLTENALYTLEAWQVFLNRLDDDGVFTVSRWFFQNNMGETARLVSLSVASLIQSGIKNPGDHIALITSGSVATIVVSKKPFGDQDIATLKKTASDLQYTIALLPGVPSSHPLLRKMVSSHSLKELENVISDEPWNYQPPTDANPYFFNMLRLNHLDRAFHGEAEVVGGNFFATVFLGALILCLLLACLITIVVPLLVGTPSDSTPTNPPPINWSGAFYFILIGTGFMFVEMSLIQRLSVFLGHPIYALGIVLFTIIASTGCGSFWSDRLPLVKRSAIMIYPIITALAIFAMRFALSALIARMITSPMSYKIVSAILMIFPVGILMGLFFPIGMRLFKTVDQAATPWYWALNGIFGVLSSALAVFISIYFSNSTNFTIAALCYVGLCLCLAQGLRPSLLRADSSA